MIYKREKTEVIKIKDLFSKLDIKNEENAICEIKFPLKIKTPYGFKKVVTAFRTENQKTVTTYFRNNKSLKSSENHLLKVNGEWKKIKSINKLDIIETEKGTTSIVRKHIGKKEILYDISVEDVNCYYSNGILSHNSWALTKIGSEALKLGKNVLHVTLELNENYVGLRYDSCFTGIDFQDVRKQVDVIKKKIDEIPGKLFIKYWPIKTIAPYTIKMHTERIQMVTGIKIDLIVVDYADLLRPIDADKNANSYSEAGTVYEELRAVAGELQVPIWSASQAHRCHLVDDKVITEKGYINIGNLKVNDKILTNDGFKKVKFTFPIQIQPVYKIKTKGGREINISVEHLLPIYGGKLKSIISGLSIGDKVFIKK